ncbi:MAG TPA: 50S ribosomal protein L11 methyltransferase [Gemmatimonadaceae bacterium]
MSWIALRITPDANRDGVIAALFESGSQGIQEDGDAVITHFPADTRIDDIRDAVIDADPQAAIAIAEAPDADYSQWRASVSAHQVGDLVITPPWLADGFNPDKTIIVDPAMAFGTGEHATTRGAIRLMQGLIHAGDVVADLGAGSAVLSIAAAKLGASRVAAVEIDPDAIGNAEENVRANAVSDYVEVVEGDATVILALLSPVRVVIANINSSVIIPLLPVMKSSLTRDGQAILAGIPTEERDPMLSALSAAGWTVEREDTEDVWWSVQVAPC